MVISIGAAPLKPKIAGIEGGNVVSADDMLLANAKGVGEKVVVVGGGLVGLETAEFLADRGRTVTVIEMLGDVGLHDIDVMSRTLLLNRLKEKGVHIRCNCELKGITPNGVNIHEAGVTNALAADTVIMAVGARSKRDEAEMYAIPGVDTYLIGDCSEAGNALDAIAKAYVMAINL